MNIQASRDADTEYVSAVIPTYNRAKLLPQAVDSVLGQTRLPDRVIVVNDGSTDETEEVLSRYGSRIEVFQQPNLGKSKALNRAIREVKRGWVWFFDDDDIAYRDAIECHLSALAGKTNAYFTYSARTDIFIDNYGNVSTTRTVKLPEFSDDRILPELLENAFFSLQGALIHCSCFDHLAFREDLYRAMDYEFMLRLVRNFPGARVDKPTFYARRHPGSRGPAYARFAANDAGLHWHLNERSFFAELYYQLHLAEYLGSDSPGPVDVVGTPQTRALTTRATVMARKGLWHLAIPDLEAIAESPSELRTLTDTDRQKLRRLTQRDYPLFDLLDDLSLVVRLRRVFAAICDPEDRFVIARQMYFTMAMSKSDAALIRKFARSLAILYLLGWHGAARYAQNKILKLSLLKLNNRRKVR